MALRHARTLELYEAQQRARDWTRQPMPIARHPVGVLGTGAMGGEIAAWLERCGLVVRGWNRRSPESFDELLAGERDRRLRAAVDAETEGILDARAFARMPRGAYVINVARGAHIVEPDLIAAVRSGHLSGAALDVQRREPLPADDPLWTVPGITITPHIAAQPSTETSPTSSSPAFAPSSAASRCPTKSTAPAATEHGPSGAGPSLSEGGERSGEGAILSRRP